MIGGAFFLRFSSSALSNDCYETRSAWSCVYAHSLFYWYFSFRWSPLSHDLSLNAFFMVAHKSRKGLRRMTRRYLWSPCGLITKEKTNIKLVSTVGSWCSLWFEVDLPRNVKAFKEPPLDFLFHEKVACWSFVSWSRPVISRLTFTNLANSYNILFQSSRCDEILLNEN